LIVAGPTVNGTGFEINKSVNVHPNNIKNGFFLLFLGLKEFLIFICNHNWLFVLCI
jgi:hypothetical protein